MSGLEHLLAQLTPTDIPDTVVDGLYEAAESMLALRRLERVAPDAVRLLIDMAVLMEQRKLNGYLPGRSGDQEVEALLARFATLNEKAGTA